MRGRSALGLLGVALLTSAVLAASAQAATSIDYTFGYTGAAQYWTVPGNVRSASFDLLGASGGTSAAYAPQAIPERIRVTPSA
jgi:hypothetical protein